MSCTCPTCNQSTPYIEIDKEDNPKSEEYTTVVGYCVCCRKEFIKRLPKKECVNL